MDEALRIRILGDLKGIKKSLKEVKDDLNQFKKEAESSAKGTDKLNQAVEKNADAAKKATKSNDDLTGSLKKQLLTAASVTAILTAGTELILKMERDTRLFESAMTGLSKEQLVSAEAQKELNKQMSEYLGATQKEIFELEALVAIARDEVRTREERQNAINTLNTNYPTLLKNLSLETIGTNDVDIAVQSLTNSLIRQAKIKGISDNLAKQYGDLDKIINTTGEDAATFTDILLAGALSLGPSGGIDEFKKNIEEMGELTKAGAFLELEKQIRKTEDSLKKLIEEENFEVTVPDPKLKEFEAGLKKAADLSRKEAQKIQKTLNDLAIAEGLLDLEDAAANAIAVAEIYEKSGARIKDALKAPADGFDTGVDQVFQEILQLELLLDRLKNKVNEDTFNLLQGFDVEQLKTFEGELTRLGENAKTFSSAVAQGIGSIGDSLARSLETDSALINAFVSVIANTLAGLLQTLAQNAIQNIAIKQAEATAGAIKSGTETAAASGPAAAFLLPALIAGAVALVAGAFGAIKFAGGGVVPGGSFVGDRVPALLNSGEMVLNGRQQEQLFNMLDSNLRRNSGVPTEQIPLDVTGVLRGTDIYLSTQRQGRKDRRFNN